MLVTYKTIFSIAFILSIAELCNAKQMPEKLPPPDKAEAFRDVPEPTATTIYGLAESPEAIANNVTESLLDGGVDVTADDGTVLSRVDHYVQNTPVWNSAGVVVTSPFRFRGLSVGSRTCGPNYQNKPNAQAAAKFAQGLSFRSLPLSSWSTRRCKSQLGALVEGINVTSSSRRFLYDKDSTSPSPDDLIYVDLVEFRGVYEQPNEEGMLHFFYNCLFDTDEGVVLKTWSGIQGATYLYGGNERTGPYEYARGGRRAPLPVKQLVGDLCQLVSPDGEVETYDMRMGNSSLDPYEAIPFKFQCSAGISDQINGGFGPLADAFANGIKVVEMLRNSSWGNIPKSTAITPSGVLRMAVHFKQDFDNAYWDGHHLYFGDGSSFGFYPLPSCIDIVGHEFGHAVTSIKSRLVYEDESGCMNEAFSDVIGEMSELYATGSNDFLIAGKCRRSGFLRNMTIPKRYEDFFPVCRSGAANACQKPHVCSSVPNYMFYKLATTPGWGVQMAGRAWVTANLVYWMPDTTIYRAGCDVGRAVLELNLGPDGYADTDAVIAAWKAGGVDISNCVVSNEGRCGQAAPIATTQPITSTTRRTVRTTTTTKATTTTAQTTTSTTRRPTTSLPQQTAERFENCGTIRKLSGRKGQQLIFIITVPPRARYQNIQVSGEGDVDLYVRKGRRPTLSVYDWLSNFEGSSEYLTNFISAEDAGQDYYLMLHGYDNFSNVGIYACYYTPRPKSK